MPLHIIKMTMIVIFVPSPPHLLLFSRVPLALPLSVFSSPIRRCVPDTYTQPPSVGPVGERKIDFSFSLSPSLLRPETQRDTQRQRGLRNSFSSRLLSSFSRSRSSSRARESLLTPTSLSACHSPSYRLLLARSFPVQQIPLYPSKGFAPVSIFVVPRLSTRAEEGSSPRASVGRPRAAYLCTSYTNGNNNRNFRWR